ncbi:MAG: 50S ribosomal protein L25/general stress protein Ctc [Pontimonas sp.]|jgi:large subunit ribosomal protein L25
MADNNTMAAETRSNFGKGAARKLRQAGKVPAVIYGHGEDPTHVSLPAHEMMLVARRANALLELDLGSDKKLVLVKDVQRDPVRQIIEHVDLVVVRKGEKVTVDVVIHVEGEPVSGTMVQVDHNSITVEAEATHIPESFTVSVEGLDEGAQIHASDIVLTDGASLVSDPETLILAIVLPRVAAAEEPSGEEGAEGAGEAAAEATEEAPAEEASEE